MRPRAVVLVALLTASSCTGVTVGPAGPGTEVTVSIVNRSDQEVTIAHEFAAEGTSGAGEALVGPCDAAFLPIGQIAGMLRIRVDGAEVLATRVSEVPREAGLVVRIVIDARGEPHVVGPLPAVGDVEPSDPGGCT